MNQQENFDSGQEKEQLSNEATDTETQETSDISGDNGASGNDWKAKHDELNDRYLRLYSEFDNYRKRTAREKAEIIKTAGADIFTALLPVLDDFDRAAKALETSTEIEAVKEGVQLIHQKLASVLKAKGLEEMNASGEAFDADLHEAITMVSTGDEASKGKVIEELEKGYLLNGKVIRFAKVVVGN